MSSSSSFSLEKSKEFYVAAEVGNLALVQSLSCDPEVNLNWQDGLGRTAFWWACCGNHVDVVRFLLDFHDNQREPIKFNPEEREARETPFAAACNSGCERVVEMLLEDERIDVNWTGFHGESPIWWPSWNGRVGVVRILVASSRKMDLLKKDTNWKMTAAEIARHRGKSDIASLLESYQTDPEGVKVKLRRDLGINARMAGELFSLVVYWSDGYLAIRPEFQGQREHRFLAIAVHLPMDLQMVLCNRVFAMADSIVKSVHSEKGFKKFARKF